VFDPSGRFDPQFVQGSEFAVDADSVIVAIGQTGDFAFLQPQDGVATRGGRIVHLDLTLVCEAPRIGPHREAMAASIARIAGVDAGRVSVKATTTEGLGFTGRREGIAAQAVATVELPRR